MSDTHSLEQAALAAAETDEHLPPGTPITQEMLAQWVHDANYMRGDHPVVQRAVEVAAGIQARLDDQVDIHSPNEQAYVAVTIFPGGITLSFMTGGGQLEWCAWDSEHNDPEELTVADCVERYHRSLVALAEGARRCQAT